MNLLVPAAALIAAAAYAFTRQADAAVPDMIDAAPLPQDLPQQLDAPGFLESIGIYSMANTRGERNNNPGNIRISPVNWQGKVVGGDAAFETFATPQAGIRALALNLRNYQRNYGLNTVRQIVTRYAPASENNTAAYIAAVAAQMGVGPDDALNLEDDAMLERLVAAIITHENGRNIYAQADIANAVRLA